MSRYSMSVYCAICGAPTSSHSTEPAVDYLSEPSIDSDDDSGWLDNVRLITQHHKSARVFIVPRAEQEEAHDFNVDFEENNRIVRKDVNMMTVFPYGPPNALDFNYGKLKRYQSDEWDTAPGMEYAVASPVSIDNVTSIIEKVLRKAKKSNVQDIQSNVATGPSSDAQAGPHQSYRTAPYYNRQRPRSRYENHQGLRGPPHANPPGPQRNQRKRQNRNAGPNKYSMHREIPETEWERHFAREFAWIREFLPPKEEIERRHVVSAQQPEASSSPEATRSTTTSSVPTSMPFIDFFRRPIKGSIPWPCEPNELRNKSLIGASTMETLTLAARDSDLNNAVRLGVDANMQRFEIHFEENGRRWSHCIGPRSTAMQYLYFDKSSAVPDRIIKCYVTMKYNIPVGLRLFSTQGQVITAGKPGNDEIAYPKEEDEEWGWLTGIFCQWSDRDSPDAKLASFGVYFAHD
ncbi:hypothetical protein FPCIR_2294 [Fusarium pseudocircinatum]|uniref:Uncharacterized protein n=1 Tax=Fusarium pseudocircinatum TaxID=56676 RepID=A0A8H5PQ64_9HYPO|nr:hypothetical protein FPCIR_2294 [Fusarium pseudocircinatum]